jgi:glycylpeptide N-tetradecanoyltransferase
VPFDQLIKNALILAKKEGFDVYNCLNLMENATVFEDLHFQIGDGNLNYYMYNWIMKCKKIQPQELGVVLF